MVCLHCFRVYLNRSHKLSNQLTRLISTSQTSFSSTSQPDDPSSFSSQGSTHVNKQGPTVTNSEDYDWRRELRVRDQRFLDHVMCHARGGAGGVGLEKFGGVGGDGGDVFLLADAKKKMTDLAPSGSSQSKPIRLRGEHGQHSTKRHIKGEKGQDLVFKVPVGTTVCTEQGSQLMDLDHVGDMIQVARGGKGGWSATNYCPQKGTSGTFKLILKLIADVGLVGFPNAGKSTLLSSISAANPSVTAFPFTTLHPNVGVVKYRDLRRVSVADTPGLIEGAHVNVGLGHRFLRHVERTKMLAYVTDVNGFQLSQSSPIRDGYETLLLLTKELMMYDSTLLRKPSVLILNKVEDDESHRKAEEILNSFEKRIIPRSIQDLAPFEFPQFQETMNISAKERINLEKVADVFRSELDRIAVEQEIEAGGEMMSPEERRERLGFELSHGLQ